MRKIFILLSVLAVTACNMAVNNNQPYVSDETYDTPEDSVKVQCAELKGIGPFQIGMSYSSAKSKKELKYPTDLIRMNNFYNGTKHSIKDYEKAKWVEKNGKDIKRLTEKCEISSDLKFDKFELFFYKDKLVGIYFEPDGLTSNPLNLYKSKYGNGIGFRHIKDWKNGAKDADKLECDTECKEEHKWFNDNVVLEYFKDYKYHFYPKASGQRDVYYNEEYYLLYAPDGYSQFKKALDDWTMKYNNSKQTNSKNLI